MRSRRSSLGIGLLALSALAAILAPLSFRGAPAQSIWRGYRVILVDRSVPEAEVLAALEAKGIGPTVSESTQPVLVSDFSSLVRLGLAEAKARLLPGDPRLDAYILGLSAWFRASEGGRTTASTISRTAAPVRGGGYGRPWEPSRAGSSCPTRGEGLRLPWAAGPSRRPPRPWPAWPS